LTPTKSVYDERPDESGLVPPIADHDQPLFQVGASPRPGHLELPEFEDRQEGPRQSGQPIFIHPPPQTYVVPVPGTYSPQSMGIIVTSHPRSRSTTLTTKFPRSSVVTALFLPTAIPAAPLPGVGFASHTTYLCCVGTLTLHGRPSLSPTCAGPDRKPQRYRQGARYSGS